MNKGDYVHILGRYIYFSAQDIFRQFRPIYVFHDDNAPPHTGKRAVHGYQINHSTTRSGRHTRRLLWYLCWNSLYNVCLRFTMNVDIMRPKACCHCQAVRKWVLLDIKTRNLSWAGVEQGGRPERDRSLLEPISWKRRMTSPATAWLQHISVAIIRWEKPTSPCMTIWAFFSRDKLDSAPLIKWWFALYRTLEPLVCMYTQQKYKRNILIFSILGHPAVPDNLLGQYYVTNLHCYWLDVYFGHFRPIVVHFRYFGKNGVLEWCDYIQWNWLDLRRSRKSQPKTR